MRLLISFCHALWVFGLLTAASLPWPMLARAVEVGDPVSAANIAKAIEQLQHDDFEMREKATEFLGKSGKAAREPLAKAAESTDLEVQERVKLALELIRLTPDPATPADVVPLVESYHKAAPQLKPRVLSEISEKGAYRTMFELAAGEKDPQLRIHMLNSAYYRVGPYLRQMLQQNHDDQAEQLLLLTEEFVGPEPLLATMLQITGRIDDRLAQWQADLKKKPDPKLAYRVALLLCAADRMPEAIKVAEQADDFGLKITLAQVGGDWKGAVAHLRTQPVRLDIDVRDCAIQIAMLHFAGEVKERGELLEKTRVLIDAAPENIWPGIQAMLIAERYDDATAAFKKYIPGAAFQLLVARQQYEEAFALARAQPGQTLDIEWYNALPEDAPEGCAFRYPRHLYAKEIAVALAEVGRIDDALAVRSAMRAAAREAGPNDHKWMWELNAQVSLAAGKREDALDDVAGFMVHKDVTPYKTFVLLYGSDEASSLACTVYDWLLKRDDRSPRVHLTDLEKLLGPNAKKTTPDELNQLCEVLYQAGLSDDKERLRLHYRMMIELYRSLGNEKKMERMYAEATKAGINTAVIRAELAMRDHDWAAIAKQYEKPNVNSQSSSIQFWLSAAQLKLGRKEASDHRRNRGLRGYPQPTMYLTLADVYRKAGLPDAATEAADQATRLLSPASKEYYEACDQLAQDLDEKEPARAALLRQRSYMQHVLGSTNFELPEYSLRNAKIRAGLAHSAVEQGKFADAKAHMRQALESRPGGDPSIVSALRACAEAGQESLADDTRKSVTTFLTQQCETYPDSAHLRSQLARFQAASADKGE